MSSSPIVPWQCPPIAVLVGVDFGGASARALAIAGAQLFASIAGGSLIEGGPVTQCESGVMQRASLVVIATESDRPSWGMTDPVAKVLGACERPVLFIPAH